MVHDGLNGDTFEWRPEKWCEAYRLKALDWGNGIMNWDGLLLDGWHPLSYRGEG